MKLWFVVVTCERQPVSVHRFYAIAETEEKAAEKVREACTPSMEKVYGKWVKVAVHFEEETGVAQFDTVNQ